MKKEEYCKSHRELITKVKDDTAIRHFEDGEGLDKALIFYAKNDPDKLNEYIDDVAWNFYLEKEQERFSNLMGWCAVCSCTGLILGFLIGIL